MIARKLGLNPVEMRLHNVGSRASAAAAWDAAGFEVVEQLRVLRLDVPPADAVQTRDFRAAGQPAVSEQRASPA